MLILFTGVMLVTLVPFAEMKFMEIKTFGKCQKLPARQR